MTRSPPRSSASHDGFDAAQLGRELVPDRPHEVRRDPARCGLAAEDDRLILGGGELRRAVLGAGHRGPARGQQLQDLVPALDDRGVLRDDRLGLGAVRLIGDLGRALLLRVADQVVVRGRLGQPGDDRRLGRVDLGDVDPEVAADRRLHAVALVAVVVLVEVGGDDVLLARRPAEVLGHPDRLDDLLELALGGPVRVLDEGRVEQALADQLLGDGRRAAAAATERIQRGRGDRHRVEAGVVPEGLVLDRRGRVEEHLGDLVEGHGLALRIAEAGQLDLAGPVVDDRFLGQRVGGQLGRWLEPLGQRQVEPDRRDRRDRPEAGQEHEGDDRDPADGRRRRAATSAGAGGCSGGRHGRRETPVPVRVRSAGVRPS